MLQEIIYHAVLKSDLIVENIGFCIRNPDVQKQSLEDIKTGGAMLHRQIPSCAAVWLAYTSLPTTLLKIT